MLKDAGCGEDVVISGFLHDIIEDTNYNYQYIVDNYGKVIADNVKNVSANKLISNWKDRKKSFIEHLTII